MIRTLIVIAVIAGFSLRYTDLEHGGVFTGIVLPIVTVVSLLCLAVWFVLRFHHLGISRTSSRGGIGTFFGDGGDGG